MKLKISKILVCTFVVIMFFAFIATDDALSAGTLYDSQITNRATVFGDNLASSISVTNYTNVQRIIGLNWAGGADGSASSGETVTLLTYLTNLCNSTQRWRIGVFRTNYDGGLSSLGWAWVLFTNMANVSVSSQDNGNTNTSAFTTPVLDPASKLLIAFRVHVDGGALSGTARWGVVAYPVYAGQNTVRYQGDNSTWYGGSATLGYGLGTASRADLYSPAGTDNRLYEITIAAPIVTITKFIAGITSPAGGVGIAIPGATITNFIYVSNTGSGNATGVKIRDYWNTNYVTAGAMRITLNSGGYTWTFRTNNAASPRYVQWSNASALGTLANGEEAHFTFTSIIK